MNDVKQALPFGDLDVEAVATLLDSTPWWQKPFQRGLRATAAKTLRDLYANRARVIHTLATTRDEYDHLKTVELPRKVDWARQEERSLEKRIETVVAEAIRLNMRRNYTPTRANFVVILSPEQFLELSGGAVCTEKGTMASTGERYAYTFKGVPLYTVPGFTGPVALTSEALATMNQHRTDLILREM